MLSLSGVLWVFLLNFVSCKDVGFLTRTISPSEQSAQQLIKIYTEEQPFQSRRTSRYVYPKSSIQTSYNIKRPYYNSKSAVSPQSQQKRYSQFDDSMQFSSDPVPNYGGYNYNYDTLQSDYGDFVNYDNNDQTETFSGTSSGSSASAPAPAAAAAAAYDNNLVSKFHNYLQEVQNKNTTTPDIYINHSHILRRPNLKTKNSSQITQHTGLDQTFFTTLGSISKNTKYNLSNDANVNTQVHKLLTKYLSKLNRRKKQQLLEPNKQVLNLGVNYLDNLASIPQETVLPHEDHIYENIDEFIDYNLNETKGKILDVNQLLLLKNKTSSSYLKNKFLSLFTIIKFQNTACQSTGTEEYYEGLCYHATECTMLNGTAMGSCAEGYGVCCVFVGSCGGTSNQNCTYFQSPNYPNYYPVNGTIVPPPTATNSTIIDPRLRYQLEILARQETAMNSLYCVFQVAKLSSDIRQLRIEFVDLELRGPTNGTCVAERLVITGQNTNDVIPAICGYNSGQHIYVDVTDVTGPIQIGILATNVERKRFRIRICQITECTNPLNCLQYFTGVNGVITSFNYEQATSLSRSVPGYYNNLNYAICIRKEKDYCSVTYRVNNNGTSFPFQITNVDENGQSTVPPGQAGAEIFSCPDDFIVINGIRLCGQRFNDGFTIDDFTKNAPVTDTSTGPFIIPFQTNSAVTGRGFKLYYQQNRCPNT